MPILTNDVLYSITWLSKSILTNYHAISCKTSSLVSMMISAMLDLIINKEYSNDLT